MNRIVEYYEDCLERYKGDLAKEVDWPNEETATIRYNVMIDILSFIPLKGMQVGYIKLLDYGCGTGSLRKFVRRLGQVKYHGYDASKMMIETANERYRGLGRTHFSSDKQELEQFYDVIVANGVFTEKRDYSDDEMKIFLKEHLVDFKDRANRIAFNIMNGHNMEKEKRRSELFFLEYGEIDSLLKEVGLSKYIIRANYLPYEFTVYIENF